MFKYQLLCQFHCIPYSLSHSVKCLIINIFLKTTFLLLLLYPHRDKEFSLSLLASWVKSIFIKKSKPLFLSVCKVAGFKIIGNLWVMGKPKFFQAENRNLIKTFELSTHLCYEYHAVGVHVKFLKCKTYLIFVTGTTGGGPGEKNFVGRNLSR